MWFPLSRLLRITPEIPGQFALLWPTTVWQLPVSVCVNVCVCPLVWSTGMSLRTNRAQKKKINKKQKSKKRREISMEVFADVVFYQQQNRRKKAFLNPCHSVSVCETHVEAYSMCGCAGYFWIFRVSGLRLFVCAHHCVCVSVCLPFLALDELLAYWWKKLIKENKCLDLTGCHTSTP